MVYNSLLQSGILSYSVVLSKQTIKGELVGLDLAKTNITKLSDEGYTFQLTIPEIQEPTGAFITVRGAQSQAVKDFSRRKYNELNQRRLVAKRKGREEEDMSLEDAEAFSVEAAAVRVMGWEGIKEGDVTVEFNDFNLRRVLKDHPWIREAVIEESDMLGNFVKK